MRDIALKLEQEPDVLIHIACDYEVGKSIRNCVNSPFFKFRGTNTLVLWSKRLFDLVSCCPGRHGMPQILQQWETLNCTIEALQTVDTRKRPIFRDMRRDEDFKPSQMSLEIFDPVQFPDLSSTSTIVEGLEVFGLSIPQSERSLSHVLEILKCENDSLLKESSSEFSVPHLQEINFTETA